MSSQEYKMDLQPHLETIRKYQSLYLKQIKTVKIHEKYLQTIPFPHF